ncbi:MAG: hypothetical protein HRU75_05180 [Planctomycetia bacterium]|nr:MAG: hypothetical protein HRU75_05180 [Planctomycetia bacterium]
MTSRSLCAIVLCAFPLTTLAVPIRTTQGSLESPALAAINVPVNGTWIVLDELMSQGNYYAPLFTYSSPNPVQIDVTDLFVVSDRNEVYVDGILQGATPAMPDWSALFPAVGPLDDAPYTTNPAIAWTRPEFSKASFTLPAGTHLLTLRNIHIPLQPNGDPYPDGTVAFRLVPEPVTAALLGALALGLRGRRGRMVRRTTPCRGSALRMMSAAAAIATAAVMVGGPSTARAGTACGTLTADVNSNVLEINGTAGSDSIRVRISVGDPAIVEVYDPATAAVPSCSFDHNATPFHTIRVNADDSDDLIVMDDSEGILSDSWIIEIDGGGGEDIVLGGINLNVTSINDALAMIATLQQASDLIDRVLDLLDESPSGCSTVPCLVENMATAARDAANDLVLPTAQYVRDIESELVQPTAAAVQDAHSRIANYVQNFLADDLTVTADEAEAFTANVEVMVDDFELLLPIGQDLLARAQILYGKASKMGLETQSGDAITVFTNTLNSHMLTIESLADSCLEDPEPTETEFNELLQDPSGLSPICAEVERRIESLESITDNTEAKIDAVEVEADGIEADGDALEALADGLGDDENPTSNVSLLETDADALVNNADALHATADAMNADWEQWVAGVELDLETRGDTMHTRGQNEVESAANALEAQVAASVVAPADAIRAEADLILADLHALMVVAAPLLRDDVAFGPLNIGCEVETTNTIIGGPGNDFLVGTLGKDRIEGGDGNDLIIGSGGADKLLGGDGNDLIFGGGGNDEIYGGDKIDILIGNSGRDCIFGGGGQTLTRGGLSVELGDLFFGGDGDDLIVSGNAVGVDLVGIDFAMGGGDDDSLQLSHGGTLTVNSFSFQFGNLAFGNGGNDLIFTRDGLDVVFGGEGNDGIRTRKGAQLTIGSGSSQFRLALGDLIFAGEGNDTVHSDHDANDADRSLDDIDFVFGGPGEDEIHGYGGGDLSIGDVSDPDFELKLGNLIFGGDQNDTIRTLAGIDVLFGGDGDDMIVAGKGDLLTIGSGSNEFRLALGDLIFGRDGDDELHGDDDSEDAERDDDDIDVIFGGNGDDTIFGYGGGLLSIGDSSDPDFELKLGNVVFGGDQHDTIGTLDGIDLIFCGAGDDTVTAGNGHLLEIDTTFTIDLGDLVFGMSGNDTLHGDEEGAPEEDDDSTGGIDLIFGGTGEDEIYGGSGGKIELPDQNFCLIFGNLLFGGPNNDFLRGDFFTPGDDPQAGIDLIFGAGGDDTLEGSEGSLIVIGDITSGQAVILGFGNILFGGPGNDTIKGADDPYACSGENAQLDAILSTLGALGFGGAADLVFCGDGNDTVEAYNGIDFVFGGDGDDDLTADHGGILVVPISGVPTPIAFGNIMFGADGEDAINSLGRILTPTAPPFEIDLLFGGPCDDVISAGNGLNLVFGGKANDTITAGNGINLLFGNAGDDTITAGSGINACFGNRDDDIVNSGDGINVLFGNRGRDNVNAGLGLNLAFGGREDDVVTAGLGISLLFGNGGRDDITGGGGLTLAFGGRANDRVTAGSGLAVLFGNAGEDEVNGANGLCVAFGNAGHDIVTAGAGLNVLFGNGGEDRVRAGAGLSVLFGNGSNDIVQAGGAGLNVLFGNNHDDVLIGSGGLNLLFGNRGSDNIFGGGGVNMVFGGQDPDTIRGGGSPDFLFGGAANDTLSGQGAKDFIFGNRGDDTIVTDGAGDFAFGNMGADTVRSGGDGSDKDYLFGNRGNDSLFGCSNADKLYGGRGSDSKNRTDCNGATLASPSRGEVRGRVMIDLNGDTIGDIPHAGITVNAGPGSAVTDADGFYRIANLPIGNHTASQSVPGGYTQVSAPASYPIAVNGPQGIDLYLNRNFVNRERCFVAPQGFGCLGTTCTDIPSEVQCLPVVVRRVMRCPDTGAICNVPEDCPCNDCVPSFAVEECDCINPFTECYVSFNSAGEPFCASQCVGGGQVRPCELVIDGDLCRCACPPPPCPNTLSQITFSGIVTSINADVPVPAPWGNVQVGHPWSITYWFDTAAPDNNGDPQTGEYYTLVFYQLTVGPASSGGSLFPGQSLVTNFGIPGSVDLYEVQSPVFHGGPPPPSVRLLLEDPTGTAWTLANLNPRDALPRCGDIVLDRFDARIFSLGASMPGMFWFINGNVLTVECMPCAGPFPVEQPQDRRRSPIPTLVPAEENPKKRLDTSTGEQPLFESLRKP